MDEALEYADDFGFSAARINLLRRSGRNLEAAQLYANDGHIVAAVKLLMHDQMSTEAAELAMQCLSNGFWKHLSFDIGILNHRSGDSLKELIDLAEEMQRRGNISERLCNQVRFVTWMCIAVALTDTR